MASTTGVRREPCEVPAPYGYGVTQRMQLGVDPERPVPASFRACRRRRLPFNALRAFEAVARHQSFTRAGIALGISQGTLSHHVILLEQHLKTRLFERNRPSLMLTKAGTALLSAVLDSFDRIESASLYGS